MKLNNNQDEQEIISIRQNKINKHDKIYLMQESNEIYEGGDS